jgi:hypothetical protein
VLTFARIFINNESAEGYFYAFTIFFSTINQALKSAGQSEIQWFHIHGTGIHAILTDMCPKQVCGT